MAQGTDMEMGCPSERNNVSLAKRRVGINGHELKLKT